MEPDLEVVEIRRDESFTVWSHGYPYRTVRWHFHPEYEIQLIVATKGTYFVGDFIGSFAPGNLVMTGPNLPHNWISDVGPDEQVSTRGLIVQFPEATLTEGIAVFPELRHAESLLRESAGGLLFCAACSEAAGPLMRELAEAQGLKRMQLFFSLLDRLVHCGTRQRLASPGYRPNPQSYMSSAMNHVLAFIGENFASDLHETELAEMAGQSVSAFSRCFRKHVGMSFVQYVNRLRINLACKLLMDDDRLSVTDICFKVGFNNVSNFNRQFLTQKKMSPSRFRSFHSLNAVGVTA